MSISSHIATLMRATTFGADWVWKPSAKTLIQSENWMPLNLWTVLEGGSSNDQWITPGYHFVNRICYLVTEKSHQGIDVEFRIPSRLNS